MVYKTFKSKVEQFEDAMFENGSIKHATQFTKMLEEISKYVQVKYNSDVAHMIKDIKHSEFKFPECPEP